MTSPTASRSMPAACSRTTQSTRSSPRRACSASTVTIPVSNPFLPAAQRTYFCANADFNPAVAGNQTLTPARVRRGGDGADPDRSQLPHVHGRPSPPYAGSRAAHQQLQHPVFDFRPASAATSPTRSASMSSASRGESDEHPDDPELRPAVAGSLSALLATNTDDLPGARPMRLRSANIFGPEGSITPEMADFISDASTSTNKSRLAQARGIINGDCRLRVAWADKPSASRSVPSIASIRRRRSPTSSPRRRANWAAPAARPRTSTAASQVYEGFAEIIAPIVTDRPFFDSLTLEGGIRRSHYTVDARGPAQVQDDDLEGRRQLGAGLGPQDPRQLPARGPRAEHRRAVLAVNTRPDQPGTDPCAGAAPLEQRRTCAAVCLAQGAPPSTIGFIDRPDGGPGQRHCRRQPRLQPEKANTWTVGAVFTPSFLPGFTRRSIITTSG